MGNGLMRTPFRTHRASCPGFAGVRELGREGDVEVLRAKKIIA
jgi:hypothetical protein